jgi:hypothetical protein
LRTCVHRVECACVLRTVPAAQPLWSFASGQQTVAQPFSTAIPSSADLVHHASGPSVRTRGARLRFQIPPRVPYPTPNGLRLRPSVRSLRPRSPFLSPLAPTLRRLSWWRRLLVLGGSGPLEEALPLGLGREGGREGRNLLEAFPAADEGSQQQPCRRRRCRR